MKLETMIGKEIRNLRLKRGETLAATAEALGIGRSYLNKIELGINSLTKSLLESIIVHFSVEGNEASQLRRLADYESASRSSGKTGGKEIKMDTKQSERPTQFNMDPSKNPILYTDSIAVTSSEHGLVLNVAQQADGKSHFVVARIGMSVGHAKKLIEVMNDHLQKYER